MAAVKIATGLKVYDIEDENGNIRGQISFNPSDMNFFERAEGMKAKIGEILEDVQNANTDDITEKTLIEYTTKCDKQIKEEINRVFDNDNTSYVVFGNQSCLNTLDGVTFVERFLEAFMPIINAAFVEEQKNIQKRVSKYTDQVK